MPRSMLRSVVSPVSRLRTCSTLTSRSVSKVSPAMRWRLCSDVTPSKQSKPRRRTGSRPEQ